jgi:hypothetical protein
MNTNLKNQLKNYFENESLSCETGYSERDVNWMQSNLIPKIENIINILQDLFIFINLIMFRNTIEFINKISINMRKILSI